LAASANLSLASAVVKAWVVTEPSIPPHSAATKADILTAFACGISGWRSGNIRPQRGVLRESAAKPWEEAVNGLIYLIGLIVVILFILSFFGLR
jgi:hypothetical protein